MARKHPHLFEKEIKGISPRTFGIELTGNSGYGVAAALTGISNDFPHTNPRNVYLYEKLLKEYAKNVDNSTDLNFGEVEFENFFPDFGAFQAGGRHSHFGFQTNPDFFDHPNNPQLFTGVPLETYSGHCVFFNSGKPAFHPNDPVREANGFLNRLPAGVGSFIQSYSGGRTGFYKQLKVTGAKFNTPEAKAQNNSQGGPIRKIYLNTEPGNRTKDIFFSNDKRKAGITGVFFAGGGAAGNFDASKGRGGEEVGFVHRGNFEKTGAPLGFFGRERIHNDFGNFRFNGVYGINGQTFANPPEVGGTGLLFYRRISNNTALHQGNFYRLLFTRIQGGKIVDHLQHSDQLISGISYLDIFQDNFDTPPGNGVHVFVFNFGHTTIVSNVDNPDGPNGPVASDYISPHNMLFQQSGNVNSPNGGNNSPAATHEIDVSAFNLYTAQLD